MEKTRIVLYGHPVETAQMMEQCKREASLEVVGSVASLEALNVFLSCRDVFVALLCFVDGNDADIMRLLQHINRAHVHTIAVCSDVKNGFAMLSVGVPDMIMHKSAPDANEEAYFMTTLLHKIKGLRNRGVEKDTRELKHNIVLSGGAFEKIIVIGSSTGGTKTVEYIIGRLPEDMPPILIVQHMPPVFTKLYAERLHETCVLSVWEARDGDEVLPGLVLIAPGERQMKIVKTDGKIRVSCEKDTTSSLYCPSVDVLFESVADVMGKDAIGVILTGMGADGAQGLLKMRQKGAYTIGQDKESSVVYGMPKAAFDLGAVDVQAHYEDIPRLIMKKFE